LKYGLSLQEQKKRSEKGNARFSVTKDCVFQFDQEHHTERSHSIFLLGVFIYGVDGQIGLNFPVVFSFVNETFQLSFLKFQWELHYCFP
jgi:hypothetical protein